jgi:hypothetical protein
MTEQAQAAPPGRDVVIGAGGLPPEEDTPDGTYPLMLTEIADWREVAGEPGSPYYKPGKTQWYRDWIFRVLDGPYADRRVTASASSASGPKSKQYGFIYALNGGKEPPVGANFTVDDLIGRVALGAVYHDDGGYPKVDKLLAMPVQQVQQQFVQATGTSAKTPSLRETVGQSDELPF